MFYFFLSIVLELKNKQAMVLKNYPKKLYFISLQCISSSLQTFVVAIAMERDPNQWKLGWNIKLLAIVYSVRIMKMLMPQTFKVVITCLYIMIC